MIRRVLLLLVLTNFHLFALEKERLLLSEQQYESLLQQRDQILNPQSKLAEEISPFLDCQEGGLEQDAEMGRQLIADGKVGCLIVAGGQASRLKCNGPKGLFPVSVVKQKSLFQIFAEKVSAAGIQAHRKLPLAIMTSPSNHEETVRHFEENSYFGLDPAQVDFFSQEELPFLDQNGDLFLEAPLKIAKGPDGSGASLKQFVDRGVWVKWASLGVRYMVYIQIDNPLADPFDAELVGYHHKEDADVVIKSIARQDPLEKLGVIVKVNEKTQVVEYSEIPPEERDARDANGALRHPYANISILSFKMDFVREAADTYYDQMPFHTAWKAASRYTPNKGVEKTMAWKFEKFVFDVLPYAKKVRAILYPREQCFAPLKNFEGQDSIQTVQAALKRFDRQIYAKISGCEVPDSKVFELDPQFYYPTKELLEKWKGRELPKEAYVTP